MNDDELRSELIRKSAIRELTEGSPRKAVELLAKLVPESKPAWPLTDARLAHRTRFLVSYAQRYSIRLSALLVLVASHTQRKHAAGGRGKKAAWHASSAWFSGRLGVGSKQFFRLLRQAKKEGLLDWERTGRGLLVWVASKKIYTDLSAGAIRDKHSTKMAFGHYDTRLAAVLGLNGSMIYSLLKEQDEDKERRKVNSRRVAACFPWLNAKIARYELNRLYTQGHIRREQHTRLSGQVGYYYFWAKKQRVSPELSLAFNRRNFAFSGRN